MKYPTLLFTITALSLSCTPPETSDTLIQQWKDEIVATELAFAQMAANIGVEAAFLAYAADDAVLMRENTVIVGKQAIREYYAQNTQPTDENLQWAPDFVDVATSGDLGYTYGEYTFTYTDPDGNEIESTSIYHTVWRRQADGSWKFVWD
jgi:ketosteroid isomerase-like protein